MIGGEDKRARKRWGVALAVLTAVLLMSAAPGRAASLYTGPGPRPGPDVLYAGPANAPELQNTGIWKAPPILVSGASAYRDGEFLYQDFLYDDNGAASTADPHDPRASGNAFSRSDGTYTYPTAPDYAGDAADLVEFRVKPQPQATAFRITLNTLQSPSLVAFSIAIGGTEGASLPFPDGANVKSPADLFLTVHPSGSGMVGDLVRAIGDVPVATLPVTIDMTRRQIEVDVPHADWNPTGQVVRLAAGVGLWNGATGSYLLPQATADATHPGGGTGTATQPAFFNVAFRANGQEPMPNPTDPANTTTTPAWWRDSAQAQALAAGDISQFHADVDFNKLAAGTADDSGVPQTGAMDRILASAYEPAQGTNFAVSCYPAATNGDAHCPGQYQGNLQPYAIYVPQKPAPPGGYGMTLLLHSLSANYNQYLSSHNQSQFGERGPGSIVITPEGRGPDGFYDGYAGADTFEVWADVARRYRLDPAWTAITGYSMGGYGTFKLAEQFPDLFAKGQPTVGESADTNLEASLRNIPILMWNASTDELVPETSYLPTAQQLDNLGYRYELDIFAPADHLTLSINDQYAPATAFLGTTPVDRDPSHVTYVVDPALDYPSLGFVADHAYYLSGLRLRSSTPPLTGNAEGTIDVFSHGFGVGDPAPAATQHGAGTLTGGTIPAIAYTSQSKSWGSTPAIARADRLDITAKNVRSVTVNAPRARVDCAAQLAIKSDGPLAVTLTGCASSFGLPSNRACVDKRYFRFKLHHGPHTRVVKVAVFINGHRRFVRRGHAIKSLTIPRLPRGKFTVRIVATQSNGSQLISTRTYHGCKKSHPKTRARHHRKKKHS